MLLPDATTLLAYLAAATLLVLVPGPGTACVLAHAASGGARSGIRAGLGLETATFVHAAAAGLGLSALLATSALAFDVVKYAGAAYLVVLGLRAWRNSPAASPPGGNAAPDAAVYRRSVLVGLLNPKAALFFLAFLPQFVDPARGAVALQFLLFGAMLAVIGFSHSLLLSLATARISRRLGNAHARWKDRLLGTTFIALGLRLAFQPR
ncbi:LysE family translocator [Lysobacter humi (ex Lee et al. 2017)]